MLRSRDLYTRSVIVVHTLICSLDKLNKDECSSIPIYEHNPAGDHGWISPLVVGRGGRYSVYCILLCIQ